MFFLRIIQNKSHTFSSENEIINVQTEKKIGNLKGLIDENGIALVYIEKVDNNNLALLDDEKQKHKIIVNLPNFWKIDEKLKIQLKNFNAV